MITYTPMITQYLKIKEKHKDSILFFRMGDFYEMFFDDAKTASEALEITLTARDGGKGKKIPMCGVPHHASENYIARLIKAGFKVAVCEQMENPKDVKGIVKREVTRYITPGTVLSDSILESKKNNYLAACFISKNKIGFAFIDLSTGQFKVTEFKNEENFLNEFGRICPSEIICPPSFAIKGKLKDLVELHKILITEFDEWLCSVDNCKRELSELFKVQSLDGFGLRDMDVGIVASGIIIIYLKRIHGRELSHINAVAPYWPGDYMMLDYQAVSNLEIIKTLSGNDKKGTLISVIDETETAMGGRMLRRWLLQPLCHSGKINTRLDGVETLIKHNDKREQLYEVFKSIADIERIISRVDSATANARDLAALSKSIRASLFLKNIISDIESKLFENINDMIGDFSDISSLIESSIIEDPPLSIKDGGFIKPGFSQELDEIRDIKQNGKAWLKTLQEKEIVRTGIKTLKVKYNKVFGYYIEITKSNLSMAPDDYIRKQTLVNAERFITPDLKEKEALILGADEKMCDLEQAIFKDIRVQVMQYTGGLQKMALGIALLDVIRGFAVTSIKNNYTRPIVNNSDILKIQDGRHPVVEQLLTNEKFVENDTELSVSGNQLAIITGPNMSGKSTYIRQSALIVLMAQIGCFVPASKCEIGVVDRIFTRVGAADELTRGQSTFMLEMNETSNILHNATKKSLLILDEVGRGTSTFDGVSIAWAIAEYIHDNIGARTLFATHYHELTELESMHKRIKNYSISCKKWNDDIIFLRKIVEGGTDKSYGIYVAKIAGIPAKVIERAKQVLAELESEMVDRDIKLIGDLPDTSDKGKVGLSLQRDLFSQKESQPLPQISKNIDELVKKLEDLDVNNITPIEALAKLSELKNMSEEL